MPRLSAALAPPQQTDGAAQSGVLYTLSKPLLPEELSSPRILLKTMFCSVARETIGV